MLDIIIKNDFNNQVNLLKNKINNLNKKPKKLKFLKIIKNNQNLFLDTENSKESKRNNYDIDKSLYLKKNNNELGVNNEKINSKSVLRNKNIDEKKNLFSDYFKPDKIVNDSDNSNLLSEKVKNYMNVFLVTNNNVNIKGNNNIVFTNSSKITYISKKYKRNNTEKGDIKYKREFQNIIDDDENEINFPLIIQSLMK